MALSGRYRWGLLLGCSFVLLAGCRAEILRAGTSQHDALAAGDRALAVDEAVPQVVSLSVYQALDRAINVNLDARVAAYEVLAAEDRIDLERLNAFPRFDYTASFLGRSNEGAASSRSLLTGSQSLEPSYSTDQYRKTHDLSMNWGILDIALTALEVKIAGEEADIYRRRYDKVIQTIERDVYAAYWRAWALERSEGKAAALLSEARGTLRNVDAAEHGDLISGAQGGAFSASILEAMETLDAEREQLALAHTELKSLLSIPQDRELRLTSDPDNYTDLADNYMTADMRGLEERALKSRPELLEALAQKNIDNRAIRREVISTFPGADIALSLNRDSNSFLQDDRWISFSGTIVQSLTSILTAPVRIRAAENAEILNDQRRVALAGAVMAQVHIARHRLNYTRQLAADAKSYAAALNDIASSKSAAHKEGLSAGPDSLAARLKSHAATIKALRVQAEHQDAIAAMIGTLGYNLIEREAL